MKTDWTFRGGELDESIQGRIGQHLNKLDRFLHGPAEGHVVVAFEGPTHQRVDLEIVIHSPLGTFTGKGDGHAVEDVARDVLQRVEAQVQRAHDKRLATRRQAPPAPAPGPEGAA